MNFLVNSMVTRPRDTSHSAAHTPPSFANCEEPASTFSFHRSANGCLSCGSFFSGNVRRMGPSFLKDRTNFSSQFNMSSLFSCSNSTRKDARKPTAGQSGSRTLLISAVCFSIHSFFLLKHSGFSTATLISLKHSKTKTAFASLIGFHPGVGQWRLIFWNNGGGSISSLSSKMAFKSSSS